jgi:Heterokaryon incompatibility protein (HET)
MDFQTLCQHSSPPAFEYGPLIGSNALRLLKVSPADADGALNLTLCHAILSEESDRYVALSYTWGSPDPIRHTALNGKRFPVRENLYEFLRIQPFPFPPHIPNRHMTRPLLCHLLLFGDYGTTVLSVYLPEVEKVDTGL